MMRASRGEGNPYFVRIFLAAFASALLLGSIGVAVADNVVNDVSVTGDDTFVAGGSSVVKYRIISTNAILDGQNGCNAADSTPATININVPAQVTASPSSLIFTLCQAGTAKNEQPVTFSSTIPGDYQITVSVIDHGVGAYQTNPASFTLHVLPNPTPVDNPPTFVSVPDPITEEATGPGGASVSFAVSATDDNGTPTVVCNPSSGSTFAIGTTTVTCTATDSIGQTATATFNVTVEDTTPPEITLPGAITAEAAGASGAIVEYTVSASDIVDGSVPVSCSPASGSTFALGTTTVNCTAHDSRGNIGNANFDVIIQDTTAPILSLPESETAEATGPSGATVEYTVSASDIVDGSVPVSCSPASGSTFALGTTTVDCTAHDLQNNEVSGSFPVHVVDTTPPALTLPADQIVKATTSSGATVLFTASASDIVDGPVAIHCDPASGSAFALGITTVNCSATDNAGNEATGSFTVTVKIPTQISDLAVAFHSNGRFVVTGELQNSNDGVGLRGQPVEIQFTDGTPTQTVTTEGVEILDSLGIHFANCTIDAGGNCPPDGGIADPNNDGLNQLAQVHVGTQIKYIGYAAEVVFQGLNSGNVVLCRDACGNAADEFTIPTASVGQSSVPIGSDTYGPHKVIVKSISTGTLASISSVNILGSYGEIHYVRANFETASSIEILNAVAGSPVDILANGGAFYLEGQPAHEDGSMVVTAIFTETPTIFEAIANTEEAAYAALGESTVGAGSGYADGNCSTSLISGANCYLLATGYTAACDSDGDGLCDDWEINGIPYTSTTGSYRYNLCIGTDCPDPNHKDLYVEIDYAPNHSLSTTAITDVKNAFAAANNAFFKVPNPDGLNGITLHVVQDEQLAKHYTMTEIWKDSSANALEDDFQDVKAAHFGTLAERNAAVALGGDTLAKMLGAKATAYHYVLSVHGLKTGSSTTCDSNTPAGQAEVSGNDIVIGLGCGTSTSAGTVTTWSGTSSSSLADTKGSVNREEGVLFHELGHNLGLDHGGPRVDQFTGAAVASTDYLMNCKPYPSTMSYSRIWDTYFNSATPAATFVLDFTGGTSHTAYGNANEASLTESLTKPTSAPTRVLLWKDSIAGVVRSGTPNASNQLSWNGDADFTDTFTTMDLNNFGLGDCGASAGQTMRAWNEWYNIVMNFRGSGVYADAAPVPLLNEVTLGDIQVTEQAATDAGIDVTAPGFTDKTVVGNTPDAASTFAKFTAQVVDPTQNSLGNTIVATGVDATSVKVVLHGPLHKAPQDQQDYVTNLALDGGTFKGQLDFTTEPDGIYNVYFRAEDNASPTHNKVEELWGTLLLDRTPPNVSLVGGPAQGGSYIFGSVPPNPTCTASDALSGLVTPPDCTVSGYSAAVGTHTVIASATDKAGNTNTDSHTYTVLAWTLKGFYVPVDNPPTVNTVKAGQTVPLKWEVFIGPTEQTSTSIITVKTRTVTCGVFGSSATDDLEQYATGGTSLKYDTTIGQYVFNWQTLKADAGKCFTVTIGTPDGSALVADFRLYK